MILDNSRKQIWTQVVDDKPPLLGVRLLLYATVPARDRLLLGRTEKWGVRRPQLKSYVHSPAQDKPV